MKKLKIGFILIISSFITNAQDYFPVSIDSYWNFNFYAEGETYEYNLDVQDTINYSGILYYLTKVEVPGQFTDTIFIFDSDTNPNLVLSNYILDVTGSSLNFVHSPTDTTIIHDRDTLIIEYFGEITVLAGTFNDVYRTHYSYDATGFVYYAPGVGMIRQDGDGEVILELKDYYDPLSTGINNLSNISSEIFPNPAHSVINISSEIKTGNFEIIDLTGKVVSSGKFQNSIDISSLKQGVYLVNINNQNSYSTQRFIKK